MPYPHLLVQAKLHIFALYIKEYHCNINMYDISCKELSFLCNKLLNNIWVLSLLKIIELLLLSETCLCLCCIHARYTNYLYPLVVMYPVFIIRNTKWKIDVVEIEDDVTFHGGPISNLMRLSGSWRRKLMPHQQLGSKSSPRHVTVSECKSSFGPTPIDSSHGIAIVPTVACVETST